MTRSLILPPDPALDLVLERTVDVPRELVWAAWTRPEHIKKWFTPAPWKTIECEIDLRPGGMFRTVMQSPEGHSFPNVGCYLEVIPHERLVFTSVLGPGYRPCVAQAGDAGLAFTGVITMESHGAGTKYTAMAIHGDPESSRKHAAMGFHAGWNAAFDQLVAAIKSGNIP